MKKGKLISLLLCLALLLGMAVPGALAVSADEDVPDGTESVQTADQTEVTGDEVQAGLFDRIMACTTMDEVDAVTASATEEELSALTEEEYAQLTEHVRELAAAEYVAPETVVFTDAGPFLPPVNVGSALRMMRTGGTEETGNGLELSKTVSAKDGGSYTIRMEAYTTGEVITTTKTVPVDIVLVLDQSGSMAYDFNGNETNTNSARRQYAMKQAVNNFIDSVAEKYSEESDHRMAIVTFGTNATTARGWSYVTGDGQKDLKDAISSLRDSPEGATNIGAGMERAEYLLTGNGYSYYGDNTERQKVVIVFTDGVPTTSTEFNTTVANTAIGSALNLKNAGATVYTVGIFNGANPDELHGEKWDYAAYDDIPCSGEPGSYWGGSYVAGIFGSNDFAEVDIPAGNRFLNYLSSNFEDADVIGVERNSYAPDQEWNLLAYGTGYRIDKNFTRTAPVEDKYYLTASDSAELNDIFQQISDNIQTSDIDLGSETVIKDTVTRYFNVPENASDVRIYTADYDGTSFGADETASGVTADVNKVTGEVTVTGFDFNANFVSAEEKTDGTHGKKLIIEFDITPKDEFIGGNDVPTNVADASGVYDKDGTEVGRFADSETDTPKVNVPIDPPEFTVINQTIHESESVDLDTMYETFPANNWRLDFVKVETKLKDTTGTEIEGDTVSPTDCTDYTVSMTYVPKTEGLNSEGSPNDMNGVTAEKIATVHVLKPVVKVKLNDVKSFYGETYTLGNGAGSLTEVDWIDKNGHEDVERPSLPEPFTKENLSLEYDCDGVHEGTVQVGKSDFDVKVKVLKDGEELPSDVDVEYSVTCDYGCEATYRDFYTVHVKTGSLTVEKTGGAKNEPYVFTVYKDGTKYTELTIVGNGEVTIYELPAGTYSVKEDTGWSWRYVPEYSTDVVKLGGENPSGTITCTNTQTNGFWLNGFSAVVKNIFGD